MVLLRVLGFSYVRMKELLMFFTGMQNSFTAFYLPRPSGTIRKNPPSWKGITEYYPLPCSSHDKRPEVPPEDLQVSWGKYDIHFLLEYHLVIFNNNFGSFQVSKYWNYWQYCRSQACFSHLKPVAYSTLNSGLFEDLMLQTSFRHLESKKTDSEVPPVCTFLKPSRLSLNWAFLFKLSLKRQS